MNLLSENDDLMEVCLEGTRYNLLHTDEPFPLGLIIDTRSPFGAHMCIDMEIAGITVESALEANHVIRELQAKGHFQSALEKAAATVLEYNTAKEKTGDIPWVLGIASRLTWEDTLRNIAAKVDPYYREDLEAIVALFKQAEAALASGQYLATVIEPGQTWYIIIDPNESSSCQTEL